MLRILGDIHGAFPYLTKVVNAAYDDGISAIIQVGDFGWYPENVRYFEKHPPKIPVYFIDGNHERHEYMLADIPQVTEVYPNLFFVPRGTVMQIDGRTIGFMGGAASIDKHYRVRSGWHWSPLENITLTEAMRFDDVEPGSLDMLITHCPPQSVIDEHFDPVNKLMFGVGLDWLDPNAAIIETLWKNLGYPFIYSGHFHKTIRGMTYRILNINETEDV